MNHSSPIFICTSTCSVFHCFCPFAHFCPFAQIACIFSKLPFSSEPRSFTQIPSFSQHTHAQMLKPSEQWNRHTHGRWKVLAVPTLCERHQLPMLGTPTSKVQYCLWKRNWSHTFFQPLQDKRRDFPGVSCWAYCQGLGTRQMRFASMLRSTGLFPLSANECKFLNLQHAAWQNKRFC